MQFDQCSMYVRNYSQIVRYLDARTPLDLAAQHYHTNSEQPVDGEASAETGQFTTQACSSGWTYDRRTFPNTVVMEVRAMRLK